MQWSRARSPAWPKGGWPRSWASAIASARSSSRPSAGAPRRAALGKSRRGGGGGRGTTPWVLRVSGEGGGSSGFQYKFDIDRAAAADDLVIEREGAIVVVDPVSLQYMAGSELDFVDDLIGASFQVENPKGTPPPG